jgi:adenosylcobinamide-phosphate synthase
VPVEAAVYLGAFVLDLVLGDPRWLPHPVVLVGKGISFGEYRLRKLFRSPAGLRWAGLILVVAILVLSGGGAWLAVRAGRAVSPYLGAAVSVYILYVSIAARDLARAGDRKSVV